MYDIHTGHCLFLLHSRPSQERDSIVFSVHANLYRFQSGIRKQAPARKMGQLSGIIMSFAYRSLFCFTLYQFFSSIPLYVDLLHGIVSDDQKCSHSEHFMALIRSPQTQPPKPWYGIQTQPLIFRRSSRSTCKKLFVHGQICIQATEGKAPIRCIVAYTNQKVESVNVLGKSEGAKKLQNNLWFCD